MKRILIAAAATCLLVPSTAAAGPGKADRAEAAKECRAALKAAGDRENLGRMFGTNRANAVRKCRAVQARDAQNERKSSAREAVKQCKAERAQTDEEFAADHEGQTFNQFYGQKGNGIGRCVSKQRRANNAEADREDRERLAAVRACRENEETSTGRAFGRCVAAAQSNENAAGGQQNAGEGSGNADDGAGNGNQGSGHGAGNGGQGDSRRPDEVPPPRP